MNKNNDAKFFEDSIKEQDKIRMSQQARMAKEANEGMAKSMEERKYRAKYRPIIETFIMDLPRDKKIEVSKALNQQDTEKLEALIKKYTSKPITLQKIPKVPKVPTKKILKDLPEYDLTIPPKIKSVQSKAPVKKMIKSDKGGVSMIEQNTITYNGNNLPIEIVTSSSFGVTKHLLYTYIKQ